MDIIQRIKNALGLSSRRPDSNTYGIEQPTQLPIQSFWKDERDTRSLPPKVGPQQYDSFGFNVFTSPLEMHRYFEHQMNDMLKNFGIFTNEDSFFGNFGNSSDPFFGDNPLGNDDLQTFQFPTKEDFSKEGQYKSGNLRDQYLKPGYEAITQDQKKVDRDLDEKFNLNELDTVVKGNHHVQVQPKKFFYGQSMTTKTILNADGTLESHKTIRDQDGNEETIVTKRHGDKEYTVTTKKNKDGAQEIIENMVNMDEKDKENFLNKDNRNPIHPNLNGPADFPYNKFF